MTSIINAEKGAQPESGQGPKPGSPKTTLSSSCVFPRGSIVRRFGDGPNMLVVRSGVGNAGDKTIVVLCEGDADGNLHMKDFPTADLEQVLGTPEDQEREFDVRWQADMRAIKMWQAANPGNDLVWPDHADLVVWLMDRLARGTHD